MKTKEILMSFAISVFQENINVGIPYIKANQFIYNLSLKDVNLEVYRTE